MVNFYKIDFLIFNIFKEYNKKWSITHGNQNSYIYEPKKFGGYISFKKNGELHNIEFPAHIYKENGIVVWISYYTEGYCHRSDDKPAVIYFYRNGNIFKEFYYVNGVLHRSDGKPAIIIYKIDGSVFLREYYDHGKERLPENVYKSSFDDFNFLYIKLKSII